MSRFLKIFALSCAFCAMAACSTATVNKPEATAKTFFEKSHAGDTNAVVALIHWPSSGGKPDELKAYQGKVKGVLELQKARTDKKGGVKEITVQSLKIDQNDPNQAVATVKMQFNNGTDDTQSVKLIKVDGQWKVSF